MANFGIFAGGAADAITTQRELGQKDRALGQQDRALSLQEQAQKDAQANALSVQADKAIGDTLSIIDQTVKAVAANPDIGTGVDAWGTAIASIESGGDYALRGPVTKSGDRAYGKYQVMGENVPVWTKEVLGTALTPEQFLANPKAQDAVFAAKFGSYVQQYGNTDDAASVWFSGRPLKEAASLSDQLGTTGSEYVSRFNQALAQVPRDKIKAVVAPLMNDVTDIAAKTGKNPQIYTDQINAVIQTTPIGVDKAIQAGVDAAKQKVGEVNGLIRAGVSKADAELTAGIKTAGGNLDPNQIVSAESTLRNQYLNQAQSFTIIRDAYQKVKSSAATPTPAGDISLIFAYMKMLDPGSTVREGEAATVQQATGVPGQIINLYNQMVTGGRLNDAQRKDFADLSAKLYSSTQQQQQFLSDQFRGIAKRSGLNPENVVVDLSSAPGTSTGAAAGTTTSAAGTAAPKSDSVPNAFLVGHPERDAIWAQLTPQAKQYIISQGGKFDLPSP